MRYAPGATAQRRKGLLNSNNCEVDEVVFGRDQDRSSGNPTYGDLRNTHAFGGASGMHSAQVLILE